MNPKSYGKPVYLPDPDHFRCIVVGDSQTSGPESNRIRTQSHRWDANFTGEQLIIGNSFSGFLVHNGTGGSPDITYELFNINSGWRDGGARDVFAVRAHQWIFGADVQTQGMLIGRFRLRFGAGNTDAMWATPWGVDAPMRARIIIRTSPSSIPAIEVRAERGGQFSSKARAVYELNNEWGVQIIEHYIPAGFASGGDNVGIGLFPPVGYIEEPGSRLQILGVFLERVNDRGVAVPGSILAYQGNGGWSIDDHLGRITLASRVAMIQATDADHVMIMIGHNREPGGLEQIEPYLRQLVIDWEGAYAVAGRERPRFIYVCPWAVGDEHVSPYLLEMERVMGVLAAQNHNDLFLNYLKLHDYMRPDVFDPDRYTLDGPRVHPLDIPTAVNLSQDLYEMLFEGRRD